MSTVEIKLGEISSPSSVMYIGQPNSDKIAEFQNLGFKPKRITISDVAYNSSHKNVSFYDEDYSKVNYRYYYDSNAVVDQAIGSSGLITAIDDNGFTLNSSLVSSYISSKAVFLISPV